MLCYGKLLKMIKMIYYYMPLPEKNYTYTYWYATLEEYGCLTSQRLLANETMRQIVPYFSDAIN